jgi:hypothetical protein
MNINHLELPSFELESTLSNWTCEKLKEHIKEAFGILNTTRPGFVSFFEKYSTILGIRLKFVFTQEEHKPLKASGRTEPIGEFVKIDICIRNNLPQFSPVSSDDEKSQALHNINTILSVAEIFDNSRDVLTAAIIHELGHVFQGRINASVIDAVASSDNTQDKLSKAISEIPHTTQYSNPKYVPQFEKRRMYEPWCEGLACEAMMDAIRDKVDLSVLLEKTLIEKLNVVEELMEKFLEEKVEKLTKHRA